MRYEMSLCKPLLGCQRMIRTILNANEVRTGSADGGGETKQIRMEDVKQ